MINSLITLLQLNNGCYFKLEKGMIEKKISKLSVNDKPLVTLVLLSYNHEMYVRESVEAALAQEYSPLEIILSDDCSSDNTFKIMESLANDYRGENTIVLSRNSKNLGLIGHMNKAMTMAKGQFIVTNGGDDISTPERTDVLVSHWLKIGKKACSIFTNAITIDCNGKQKGLYFNSPIFSRTIDEFIETKRCWLGGFSHGFSKELYIKYGPITEDTFQEDGAISFRALLNSGIHYLDQPTVFYRRHSGNSYSIDNYLKFRRLNNSELGLAKGRLADLKKHAGLTIMQHKDVEKILSKQIRIKFLMTRIPGIIESIFLAKWLKVILRTLLQSMKGYQK